MTNIKRVDEQLYLKLFMNPRLIIVSEDQNKSSCLCYVLHICSSTIFTYSLSFGRCLFLLHKDMPWKWPRLDAWDKCSGLVQWVDLEGLGGRREGGSGWGTHVNPWLIHVNVWQKQLQYCKVISLQLIKINEKKSKRALHLLKKKANGFLMNTFFVCVCLILLKI